MVNQFEKIDDLMELLPSEIEIPGWLIERDQLLTGKEEMFRYMNGGAELYFAFNFEILAVREFVNKRGDLILVELYRVKEPKNAFGLYTFDTSGEKLNIGKDGVYSSGLLKFWKGRYFCRVLSLSERETFKDTLIKIGHLIARKIKEKGELPIIISILPDSNRVENSMHFFHRNISLNNFYYISDANILNLDENTDAVIAEYSPDGAENIVLLLIEYRNSELSLKAYKNFVEIYLKESPEKFVRSTDFEVYKRLENGKIAAIDRLRNYLILSFEGRDPSYQKKLIKEVKQKCKFR